MNKSQRKTIWNKTNGYCHFCGSKLIFSSYGPKARSRGKWQVDHIFPKKKGGVNLLKNYLPICRVCNRLRWMWTGNKIQKLFRYGIIVHRESRCKTEIGKKIRNLYLSHKKQNKNRRKNKKSKIIKPNI